MPPKGAKKIECPECGGRGVKAVGDVDMECANCEGTGQVFDGAEK